MEILHFQAGKGQKFMKEPFGTLPDGRQAWRYRLRGGDLCAEVTDYGATLVRLLVPDAEGTAADVVLGYDSAAGYASGAAFFGGTVGRNANRICGAAFTLGTREYRLHANEGENNLHSGPDYFHNRLWTVEDCAEDRITFRLDSPDGDQGFPGNAVIRVRYRLEPPGTLRICYDARCDRDTVFNLTNHSYFNLAGHDHPERAMEQTLTLPARHFTPDDAQSIPTGELRPVAGTPMDFRVPKPLGRDLAQEYEPLLLQGGYDHNFEVFCAPCAILRDPFSGRSMAISTDCPGIQVYTANFVNEIGKGGVHYPPRSAVALETQAYPDAVHHPQWRQPVTPAGRTYHSETRYRFF